MGPTRRSFLFARLILAITGAASVAVAVAGEFVVVSATAAPGYKRTKGSEGIMAESYVFSPGIHFGGALRNRTLEHLPFLTVVQMLAPSLARQKYFPAKDPAQANLAIVVHWGATQVYDNPNPQADIEALNTELAAYKSAIQESGAASSGAVNGVLSTMEGATSQQERYLRANAELLGYQRTLSKEGKRMFSSEDEITLRSELIEERYFVVLMAYDYQLMKKEKTPRLLWVTRMSIRSPGNNFAESVPGMARVAADFFGQQRDEITRIETKLREGKVDIGELKVVEAPTAITPPRKAP